MSEDRSGAEDRSDPEAMSEDRSGAEDRSDPEAMSDSHEGEWYWCLRHERPEPAGQACEAEQRLGPYSSQQEARAWKDRVDARNEQWDSEDRRWEGD